ncbi:MAG: aminotransferase class I and II [Chloroflexota bacterium]|nr:aminotransferase class I and II [Chloroflexota bacterium]
MAEPGWIDMGNTARSIDARIISATRYVMPLREGGSLPGLVEGSDDGLYVVKFRGAGQGPKTLVAEMIAGAIGRRLGLHVPEIVLIDIPAAFGRIEPDPEIAHLLDASVGLNLGLDFLPGALPVDALSASTMDARLAADIVWFDALLANVDRTTRNTNMLRWHEQVWLIDHGAAIYVHHRWTDPAAQARAAFPAIREHVLLPVADSIISADSRLAARLTEEVIWETVAGIPDEWLGTDPVVGGPDAQRRAYFTWLTARLQAPRVFVSDAESARTEPDVGVIDPQRQTRGRRRG